jgi:DNA polymerase alpha subunit A
MTKRLKEEDFVVDDDGQGYADDGTEDWNDYEDESDSMKDNIRKTSSYCK